MSDMEYDKQDKEMPSLNHSYICLQILRQLIRNEQFEPLPELTLDIGKGLTPDISVFPKEKIRPNFLRDVIRFKEMPILAVEVVSVSQSIQELLDKASLMVLSGIRSVWTVEPYGQTIFITTPDGEKFQHDPNVESEGIRVNFREVFGTGYERNHIG